MVIELKDRTKIGDSTISRAVAPLDTYHRIRPLMSDAGLSHVIEITNFDVLGLPVFFAFGSDGIDAQLAKFTGQAPEAFRAKLEFALANADRFPAGNSSIVRRPVFGAGKGVTCLDAKLSAMMESIERFSARYPSFTPIVGSYREMLEKRDREVLDPRLLVLQSPDSFDANQELEWVAGTRLGQGDEIWVPADAATFSYQPCFGSRICSDTPTGLGAGNTLEEAVSHGLAEAIEHDGWTLAVVCSSISSAKNGILNLFFGKTEGQQSASPVLGHTEEAAFIRIDLESIEGVQPIGELMDRIRKAGVRLNVYWVTTDIGIPIFSVSIEGLVDGQDGGGLGAHPDARVAISRALTEAAQQRLLIGVRSYFPQAQLHSTPWKGMADGLGEESKCNFSDVASNSYSNILDDIHYMTRKLAEQGLEQVIVVDLTKPEFNIPVVKVIVPGLADYWTSDTSPNWNALGPRVRRYMQ